MLRITIQENAESLAFQLEGRLVGPWVQELKACWQSARRMHPTKAIRLELRDVTSIDAAGKQFLADAHAQGAEFVCLGCLMKGIVGEIRGASAPAHSPGSFSPPWFR